MILKKTPTHSWCYYICPNISKCLFSNTRCVHTVLEGTHVGRSHTGRIWPPSPDFFLDCSTYKCQIKERTYCMPFHYWRTIGWLLYFKYYVAGFFTVHDNILEAFDQLRCASVDDVLSFIEYLKIYKYYLLQFFLVKWVGASVTRRGVL
jgi:hypothetical protein